METVTPGRRYNSNSVNTVNSLSGHPSKGMAYQAYQVKRRTIIGSPEDNGLTKFSSPEIYRSVNIKSMRSSDSLSQSSGEYSDKFVRMTSHQAEGNYSKNPKYQSYSPVAPEVSLPGGKIYTMENDRDDILTGNMSGRSSGYGGYTPRDLPGDFDHQTTPIQRQYNTPTSNMYHNEHRQRETHRHSDNRRKSRSSRRRSYDHDESDDDSYDEPQYEDDEEREQRRRERREEKARKDQMMNIIIQDFYERKQKEKEEAERKTKEPEIKPNTTPKPTEGSFQIPKAEPVKQRIPNYEELSEEDKLKTKNKFVDLFQTLKNSYPDWNIEPPDFNNLPLRIIHERYEQVVKTICIYQTAMKWKVYLIIIIAGIEYYGYNVKGYTFLKGLLKQQIKSIHKYNSYLIEIAEMFYSSDESGDNWPLWMRFMGTIGSSLASFCGVSGLAKAVDFDAPDFAYEQADKFMSPPEGTAKLRTDCISDLPTPPSGFQNPDTVINVIGKMFNTFTGQGNSQQGTQSSMPRATAQPVNSTKKDEDDEYDVEF